MQLVELDRLGRGRKPVELEAVEVRGAAAGRLEEVVNGPGVHVSDVGRRLDRAAVSQALDDPDDGLLRELAVPQQGPLPLGEPALTG